MLRFESSNCQTYAITLLYEGHQDGDLDQGLLRPWQERKETPGKGEPLETTEVEIQTKEIQAYLLVLIYSYSLKGLYSRVNQTLSTWSVRSVQHGLCVMVCAQGVGRYMKGKQQGA